MLSDVYFQFNQTNDFERMKFKQEANKSKNNYIWEVKQTQMPFDIGKASALDLLN